MNAVLETIRSRRSVRRFADKAVPRELIEQVAAAGEWAPTGMNNQTVRLTVLTDRARIRALAQEVGRAAERGADYDFYAPPVFILVSDRQSDVNAQANCACALENMMLAAQSLGLGSVWINQMKLVCGDAGVRGQLEAFGVPQDHTVGGCLALGYAADAPRDVPRKPGRVVFVED